MQPKSNNYYQTKIRINPYVEAYADLLAASLAEIGYESFEPTSEGLSAYCPAEVFSPEAVKVLTDEFPYEATVWADSSFIQGKDWNEEWEKNYFRPIIIGNDCVIHSSFHTDVPIAKYDIVIDPRMAFGTGHHATTALIIEQLLRIDLAKKSLLDMGCGTAILAILAAMRGAHPITAIDIDYFCYENAIENARLNSIDNITVLHGTADLLTRTSCYDVILANINRNILLQDMETYAAAMHHDSLLIMSGFYTEDAQAIIEEGRKHSLTPLAQSQQKNWCSITLIKKAP